MNFLCPSCRTPLPDGPREHLVCAKCGVAVDLARAETAPGQARLWPEVDLSGEALGRWSLRRQLGRGGMGAVYEAEDAAGRVAAVKVLSPLLAAEPALRERFLREARALGEILHASVVRFVDAGEERGFSWYAMERIQGEDLRTRLLRGPLPAETAADLAEALLAALAVVHAAGLVHRDVKPGNILLGRDGPKLCDFGIARVEAATTLTESAALLGSLRYMAPEQRWGRCDARSDLYALGVVLHEALALGVPGERPLPLGTPPHLLRTIARLTDAAPERRPASAAAALRELRRLRRWDAQRAWRRLAFGATAGVVTSAAALLFAEGGGLPDWGGDGLRPAASDAGAASPREVAAAPLGADSGAAVRAPPRAPFETPSDAGTGVLALVVDAPPKPQWTGGTPTDDAGTSAAEGVLGGDASVPPVVNGEPVGPKPSPPTRSVAKPLPATKGPPRPKGKGPAPKKPRAPAATDSTVR